MTKGTEDKDLFVFAVENHVALRRLELKAERLVACMIAQQRREANPTRSGVWAGLSGGSEEYIDYKYAENPLAELKDVYQSVRKLFGGQLPPGFYMHLDPIRSAYVLRVHGLRRGRLPYTEGKYGHDGCLATTKDRLVESRYVIPFRWIP